MVFEASGESLACMKKNSICIPKNYSKFDLPIDDQNNIALGIDVNDIPKIDDHDFSMTLSVYINIFWKDPRLITNRTSFHDILKDEEGNVTISNSTKFIWTPVSALFIKKLWLPDLEIRNIKKFEAQSVLSKLEGMWIDQYFWFWYQISARITITCPMEFNSFPLDVQYCPLQVVNINCKIVVDYYSWLCYFSLQIGSFNYEREELFFREAYIPDASKVTTVLDYTVEIEELPQQLKSYISDTGKYVE